MFGIFQYRANIKELQKTIKCQTTIIDSQLNTITNRENTIDKLWDSIHSLEAKVYQDTTPKSGDSFTRPEHARPKDRTRNNDLSSEDSFSYKGSFDSVSNDHLSSPSYSSSDSSSGGGCDF